MAKLLSHALMRRCATVAFFALLMAPVAHSQSAEAVTWARADTCPEIRAYIAQYPSGRYVGEARAALNAKNCPDPEADARRAREAANREVADLRKRLKDAEDGRVAAERRAADEARLRREAEKTRPVVPAVQTTPQDSELARLASIRGDWIQSWLNSTTPPSTFRDGYYILGASTKTGGWFTSSGYPCGGAIVRGNTWYTPSANSTLTFELVYGRLPSGTTSTTHGYYHSRTTYLGATFQDAWRALSEAAYVKSGQSCGGILDRRYITPAPSANTSTPATTTPAPTALNTESELTRLAGQRGGWTAGYENSSTEPASFRGYFIVGADSGSGWMGQSNGFCGGAIVRGQRWLAPGSTGGVTSDYVLAYGRKTGTLTPESPVGTYARRLSYLGATWNSAWVALSESAYTKSGQSCGSLQDRRYTPVPASTTPAPATTTSVRDQVQREIAGTWQRVSGQCSSGLNRFAFPNGALEWTYTIGSNSSWYSMTTTNWTITYENRQLLIVSGSNSRTTVGMEGSNLVWRTNGNVYCTMSRQ